MGLISLLSTIGGSISSTVKDQYLEFFTCDALGQNVLVRRGAAKIVKGNNKGSADIISNGAKIAVPSNTACILVNNGQVVDCVMEEGMYEWNSSTEPSILADKHFGTNLKNMVKETWERMKFGGEVAQQQRIFFINLMEIRDQKFGTATPLPYPDPEYRNIYIRLNGSFSFKIEEPVTFYKNCCSNISGELTVAEFMGTPAAPKQPREEFMDHMTEALNLCGAQDRIMFSLLPSKKSELRKNMQTVLDDDWRQSRGMVVEAVALGIPTPDDKSRALIERIDQAKNFASDEGAMMAQTILGAQEAMNTAAGNSAGAMTGVAGVGMLGGMTGAMNTAGATDFFAQKAAAKAAAPVAGAAAVAGGWKCECGNMNTGKFCGACGKPQPVQAAGWQCECGNMNTGKFCSNCGKPQPSGSWKCECGAENTGKFCSNCGKPQP